MQRLLVQRDMKILGQRDEILRCDRLPLMRSDTSTTLPMADYMEN